MDDENRLIGVSNVNYLEDPTTPAPANHQPLVLLDLAGIRWLGLPYDKLRFFPVHAMLGKVIAVPVNPPKLHDLLLPVIVAGEGAAAAADKAPRSR
jgi:hypothetical protein